MHKRIELIYFQDSFMIRFPASSAQDLKVFRAYSYALLFSLLSFNELHDLQCIYKKWT